MTLAAYVVALIAWVVFVVCLVPRRTWQTWRWRLVGWLLPPGSMIAIPEKSDARPDEGGPYELAGRLRVEAGDDWTDNENRVHQLVRDDDGRVVDVKPYGGER